MGAGAIAAGGVSAAARSGLTGLLVASVIGAGALAGVAVSRAVGRWSSVPGLTLLWAAAAIAGLGAAAWSGPLAESGRFLGIGSAGWVGWMVGPALTGLVAGLASPLVAGLRPPGWKVVGSGLGWALVLVLGLWIALVAGYLLSSLADEGPLGPDRLWLQGVGWALGGLIAGLVVGVVGRILASRWVEQPADR